MTLPDGMTDLAPGKIAAIATVFERSMDQANGPAPQAPGAKWRFERDETPDLRDYLDLWRRVGGPQLWYGRLVQSEAEVAAYLAAPTTAVFRLIVDGRAEGIADLDFSVESRCELVYFGVTPTLVGKGAGGFMMGEVLAFVKEAGTPLLWLHTNTLDHAKARGFYARFGFEPVSQKLELADDPRLVGLYPRDTAPQIPIFP
ncbi:GNAT family N-acetyltransferase [Fulvimarina endophytica]|uniref:GNAT family N-acetyltransferase n=1 Tax=Fulvimarina endophytica TaxID=2293836 RepID=A0A371X0C4_9HYPH|nr:GNAT family N-acetyltransferase [Fulvimarina endophytica]RFC62662.1 GNAT family N-acetyltransferase [Fulvimarina endophytica]